MSGTVNIRRDVKDAFYRYKMPRLQSKIEGKGNGIKTVVSNMVDVAKALNRPPAYVTKFFGNELGSIVHCDDKTGRYIVNGAHDADKLAVLLDGFIGKFVLCQACDNPETELSVGKDGTVWRSCKACGHRSTVDMGHKLVAFIQKNPPKRRAQASAAEGGTAESDAANADDSLAIGGGSSSSEMMLVAPEGLEEEQQFREQSKLSDDWADTSKLREEELSGLSAAVRSTLHVEDPVETFADWVRPSHSDDEIARFIEERSVPRDKAVAIIVQVLMDPQEGQTISSCFSARSSLFQAIIAGEKEQKAFLGGLERLLGLHRPELLHLLPALLQAAYNDDIVEEEAIIAWHSHVSKRYMKDKAIGKQVRDIAQPFIDWLQTDEGDDSSSHRGSDDDGDNDE